jgi:hypothetical protein
MHHLHLIQALYFVEPLIKLVLLVPVLVVMVELEPELEVLQAALVQKLPVQVVGLEEQQVVGLEEQQVVVSNRNCNCKLALEVQQLLVVALQMNQKLVEQQLAQEEHTLVQLEVAVEEEAEHTQKLEL